MRRTRPPRSRLRSVKGQARGTSGRPRYRGPAGGGSRPGVGVGGRPADRRHGTPLIDSTVALSAAAAVTTRVRLGFGVMILPLHPVVGRQAGRLAPACVGRPNDPRRRRRRRPPPSVLGSGRRAPARARSAHGRRAVCSAWPDSRPAHPAGRPAGSLAIQLAPPATVPPILVGGMSDAALVRAAEYGDGWFAMSPGALPDGAARLAELAAARKRPVPQGDRRHADG